jgi:hypothetical protein
MTPQEALEELGIEGELAVDHFNDCEDVVGYFGWDVLIQSPEAAVLTITYEDAAEDEDSRVTQVWQWAMRRLA